MFGKGPCQRLVVGAGPLVGLLALTHCGAPPDLGRLSQAMASVCPNTVLEGVDVADGEGTVDWGAVANSGRRFAFTKATQGDYFTASTFNTNWSGIAAAGMYRGPYHFFDGTIDGVAQADHFLAVLNDAGGLQPDDLPPVLDIECPTSSSQSAASTKCEYPGNSGWAPPSVIAQRAFDWLNTVAAATGRTPLVYSYPSWFSDVTFTDPALASYPLWIASLSNTCATVPDPWSTTVFWQYSFSGTVPGINAAGCTDLDRFIGDETQLIAFIHPDSGSADGGPPDAGLLSDAGVADSGVPDGGTRDSGSPATDSGSSVEGGPQQHAPDGGSQPEAMGGCGCQLGSPGAVAWAIGLFALSGGVRRRRGNRPLRGRCPRPG
jgi:lysozyme